MRSMPDSMCLHGSTNLCVSCKKKEIMDTPSIATKESALSCNEALAIRASFDAYTKGVLFSIPVLSEKHLAGDSHLAEFCRPMAQRVSTIRVTGR